MTTAIDIMALAATIDGHQFHKLGVAWAASRPTAEVERRVWKALPEASAFLIWDGLGDTVFTRFRWSPTVSDGLWAMRCAALAVAAREQVSSEDFASLAGPWESVMGPLSATV